MADEEQIEDQNTEEDDDFWSSLGLDNPDDDDSHDDEQSDEDEAIDKIDKTMKKYTSKMEERMKEFDKKLLRERVKKFQESADPVEVDFFKAVASEIASPEEFDKAVALAQKHAKQIKSTAEEYKTKYEEQAKEEAARAWGTGPIGSPTPKPQNYEEERSKKIAKGDTSALTDYLLEGFNPGKPR